MHFIDYNYPELSHESTVALQFMQRHHWLSCPSTTCGGGICPEHCFEESDWTHCWGQVFRMYRAAGPGNILNGDFVGLYYVHENKWFSMWEGLPHKATCPGNPSSASGFQEYLKWFKCAGEVFQVYAKGKSIGAKIIDQDIISLYYPADVHHVVFSNEVSLSRCMLQTSQFNLNLLATTQPFDDCENMGVYITIKRLPPE